MQPGALTVVLGGNGCGKTTLLRCINRALRRPGRSVAGWHRTDLCPARPASRQAEYRDDLAAGEPDPPSRRGRQCRCGGIGRHQTWWTAFGGLPAAEMLPGYLDDGVGLAHLAGQRAGTLSGGQAQRVAIARALAQRPRLLLAMSRSPAWTPRRRTASWVCCGTGASRRAGGAVCAAPGGPGVRLRRPVVGMRAGRLASMCPRTLCRASGSAPVSG